MVVVSCQWQNQNQTCPIHGAPWAFKPYANGVQRKCWASEHWGKGVVCVAWRCGGGGVGNLGWWGCGCSGVGSCVCAVVGQVVWYVVWGRGERGRRCVSGVACGGGGGWGGGG